MFLMSAVKCGTPYVSSAVSRASGVDFVAGLLPIQNGVQRLPGGFCSLYETANNVDPLCGGPCCSETELGVSESVIDRCLQPVVNDFGEKLVQCAK